MYSMALPLYFDTHDTIDKPKQEEALKRYQSPGYYFKESLLPMTMQSRKIFCSEYLS